MCVGLESLRVSSFGIEFANDRAAKQSHKITGTCSDHTRPQARCKKQKADSTLRSSQAVPHPSTGRALCRLTSEVRRDPVHSTRYGRQRDLLPSANTCGRKAWSGTPGNREWHAEGFGFDARCCCLSRGREPISGVGLPQPGELVRPERISNRQAGLPKRAGRGLEPKP